MCVYIRWKALYVCVCEYIWPNLGPRSEVAPPLFTSLWDFMESQGV